MWEVGRAAVWEVGRATVWEVGRATVWEVGRATACVFVLCVQYRMLAMAPAFMFAPLVLLNQHAHRVGCPRLASRGMTEPLSTV